MRNGIVIYGGTFNPPHLAHKQLVEAVVNLGYEVLVVPNSQSPLKTSPSVSGELRMKMLSILLNGLTGTKISDRDINRKGVSYMENTIKEVQIEHPGKPISLLIGSDILCELPRWKNFENWHKLVTFLIVPRKGHNTNKQVIKNLRINAEILPLRTDISSTEIRKLVALQKPITHLTGKEVENIIVSSGIYQAQTQKDG